MKGWGKQTVIISSASGKYLELETHLTIAIGNKTVCCSPVTRMLVGVGLSPGSIASSMSLILVNSFLKF